MKPNRWETFVACVILLALAILILAAVCARAQTARATSDASLSATAGFPPVPSGLYVPPQVSVAIVWTTNRECLSERVTISSNAIPVWRWLDRGVVYTNFATPLSSNIISVATNEVQR